MRSFLYNPWLCIAIRMSLGGIFIYSSFTKLADPPGFAKMIWNYKLLPMSLINPLAIILPWLELFAGLSLLTGILRRGSALLVSGMIVVFCAALAVNLVRGNPIDCGCFSLGSVSRSKEELLAGMWLDLTRDLGILLMSLQALTAPISRSVKFPTSIGET